MKKFGMMLLALSRFSVTLGCSGEEDTAPAADDAAVSSDEDGSDDTAAEKEGEAAEDEAAE